MTGFVLVTNHFFDDTSVAERVLADLDVEVVTATVESRAELLAAADGAAAVVNPPYSFTFDCYDRLPDLAVVAVMGVGVDHIDLDAAAAHDVHVVNAPEYCVEEVSTHALGLLIASARRIPLYDDAMERNEWDWRRGRPVPRLAGRTLGFVGFGRIARRLARKVDGFDLDLIAYDPYVAESVAAEYGVELVGFEEFLTRSELISVHAPTTEETRGLVDAEAFAAMDDGVVLVNTSRGAVVDESALCDALESGRVLAAGLDVFEREPTDAGNPLLDRDDVVTTPHVGWYSETAANDLRERVFEDVRRVLVGAEPERAVVDPADGR